jgi:Domain of unknown function (DUF5122) beta-propeller
MGRRVRAALMALFASGLLIAMAAARLDSGGSLDSGFGSGGVLTTNFQGGDTAEAVVVQPNGDIVAIGSSEDNATGVTDIALARYVG